MALIIIVLSVSVMVQSEHIKTFIYNQQAQYYIYEAQEVASFIKNESSPEVVHERLKILDRFLNVNILAYDKQGHLIRVPDATHETKKQNILDKDSMARLWRGENIIYTGKVNNYPVNVFLAAVPIKNNNSITGAVVVYSPIEPLQQQINSIRKISFWSALLGMALATILSVFILKTLTRPLFKMEEAAYAIAKGEFGKQVPVTSNDEVGRLASSLNNMSIQLKEKIEAIEKYDQTRQKFVSNVSHELRTPLTIIQSFSEAILDGIVRTEEERDFYLKNILEESKRLKRLVDDLLDLKALEEGDVIDEMEYVSISKLVNVTVGNFKTLAAEKDIDLSYNPNPKEVTVYGNNDRLKQVMTNLIGNAIAYTSPGGKIKIAWGEVSNEAYISVADNGPGIPPDELENIWERFYKVDKSRVRDTQGTGLGLAIVKRITELHRGEIKVESTLGKGSVFTVLLPIVNDSFEVG